MDLASDLREIMDDQSLLFRASLTWDGQTIHGERSPPREMVMVEEGSEYVATVFDFMAVRADFTGSILPAQRETVQVGGVKHFVHEVQTDQAGGVGAMLTLRREA
jgi:hypothetical protein